ncbi:MAG: hypothetical protein ACLFSE_03370 [Spirochaetia bacterium]
MNGFFKSHFLKRIYSGNIVLLKWIGLTALTIGTAALSAVIVVYPLWYIAVRWKSFFTIFSLILIGAALLVLIIRRFSQNNFTYFLKKMTSLAIFAGFLFFFYVVIVLFAQGLFIAAVPAAVLLLGTVALAVTRKKTRH